jgi:beta-glucanase (GH16 family)
MNTRFVVAGMPGLLLAAVLVCGQTNPFGDNLPQPPAGRTWKMIWHDEFDGVKLDEAKWETPPDGPRHAGWWMRKAILLDGRGHLVIQTSREGDRIIDGCVRTKGRFAHAFGFYVARVQLPREQGHWPGFWLFEGCHVLGNSWWNGAEIDILEKFWPNDEVKHTIFGDASGNHQLQSQEKVVTVPGIREGWHTFACWRKPDEYVFFVDGKETWRINPGAIIQVPQYIKLSDETDTWCKDISKASLPDRFLVDYVRVYDLVDKK